MSLFFRCLRLHIRLRLFLKMYSYHSHSLKSHSKLRASIWTFLLHEKSSLFSYLRPFRKKSAELLKAAAIKCAANGIFFHRTAFS